MTFHNETRESVVQKLGSNQTEGLSEAQASDRLAKYGENKLKDKKKKSYLQRFFDQFKDVMILILLIAAAISFGIACAEKDLMGFFEPALILLIVILNAVMGVMQESKAEKALDELKDLSVPHAKVIRSGKERVIEAIKLVPGDMIHLEAGDFVPADARLLHSSNLKSEESALTGESVPTEKNANAQVDRESPLGDRINMIYSGCSITYGTATAIVTATGMDTEIGKIADLLNSEEETLTPLQKKLSDLGKKLGLLALVCCTVIFIVGLINGIAPLEIFMTAVSLAVSAIPEGLPAIVTIVLSIGVGRMAKKNAIIRRLPAVETLGSASVICSDKTGTLTQNKMTLKKAWVSGMETAEDISSQNTDPVRRLLEFGVLCSNAAVVFHQKEEQHIGDPTETAIISAALKNGISKEQLNKDYPCQAQLPFDSDRKRMTSIHHMNGKNIVIVKGAFDRMASLCIDGDLETAQRINEKMSKGALRVLAVAYKEIPKIPEKLLPEELENDLIFVGLVGMMDPPRPEVKEAVALCRQAGIKPVMITGDHIATASAIARELGIIKEGDVAITGSQLDAMTEQELGDQIEQISVYARVSPENKIRIVKAWQNKHQIVSMTGDGVNDAPALKAADIGCAMGITGTDVAKGAADMTLTDDNFATIVEAVREGRGIYANIRKVIGFLLGTNIGEVIAVFASMLLWHKSPLLSMQLLWINLVTDSLPAIALGMEPVEADIMNQKPKPKEEGLFAHGFGIRTVLQGCMFGILALIAYWLGETGTDLTSGGQTMAFFVLSLSQIVQVFNMRSERSLFQTGIFTNPNLNRSVLISALLVGIVLFTPLHTAFGLIFLPGKLYLQGLILILVPVLVMELSKTFGLIKYQK